jgi:hypothetical protein
MSSLSHQNHNLDIHMYSFQDILQLFDICDTDVLTPEHLKKAKKKVLKTHPDKSGLPSQYFLFYKKAFDIVYEYFQEHNKIHRDISKEKMEYDAPQESHSNSVEKHIESQMSNDEFHHKFNELFEKFEMGSKVKNKNIWFQTVDNSDTTAAPYVRNAKEIHTHISQLKEKNRREIIVRQDFQESQYTNHLHCYNLYEGGEEEDSGEVVSSDIFAKLKFEDIKRVHRDETVFSVDETDFEKVEKFHSVEEYKRKRKDCDLTPLEQDVREVEWKKERMQLLQKKEFESKKRTNEMIRKNAEIISYFLPICY